MIERVGILAKHGLTAAVPHLSSVIAWLQARDMAVVLDPDTAALVGAVRTPSGTQAGASSPNDGCSVVSRDDIPRHVDLIVVLGGDGTLLGVADRVGAAGVDIPVLGVNFGRLGFLTEVALPEMLPTLESVLNGTATIHERSMLHARTSRDGVTRNEQIVLNDVVVTKGTISRLIYLAVYVDGEFVTDVKADGLILASPTGSTAYNLAAGGPIVHPGLDALLLTPIAPHALGNRPIVLPGRSCITVKQATDAARDELFVTFDGQSGFAFGPGDEVTVTCSDRRLRLVASQARGYYDTLRQKLHWGER